MGAVSCAVTKRIAEQNGKKKGILSRASSSGGFEFMVLTPEFVVIGDSTVLSVDEALEKKLLGCKYTKKGVDIDPTVVSIILKGLQQKFSGRGNPVLNCRLRFSPWLQVGESFDDDWKEVVQRYNALTATVCSIFKVCGVVFLLRE